MFECAQVAVPAATEQAMRFYKSGNLLWIIQNSWSLIIPLLILFTGFSSKMEKLSARLGKNWYFTIVIYLVLFILLYNLLNFPIDFYSGFIRQHAYGLSAQTFSRWLSTYSKELLMTIIFSALSVWIFYLLLKKSPRRWWFYSALVSIGIGFIFVFIKPIWIDPLFNHFGPMKNKQLETEILALAKRAGIDHGRVFEVDKSQDTKTLNAYVTGFGSSARIVLWDTTLARMKPDEILFVMGHEMGHYVLHHIWWDMLYTSVLNLAIFFLIYKSAHFIIEKYPKRLGFQELHQIASLPLLLFLGSLFILLSTPLSNYVSRTFEKQADRFGLEITQNNKAAAEAFIVLQKQNLANPRPGPIYKVWRCTHPPLGERIDFCNSYCPWKQGLPLEYGKDFK
ncbi:MAG: M48 family metallopeptidase [Verrucomicrobia bacterium]|nr:M48 family metallopeptidase [Verrucomicrobiota bacterium]